MAASKPGSVRFFAGRDGGKGGKVGRDGGAQR
jgi:hypothetical protein